MQSSKWEESIHEIEKHNYFAGQIGFILEFSIINNDYNIELFNDYSLKLQNLFGDIFRNNKSCLFQRALLCFGDYLVKINSGKTFCTFNESLREKMDNWRKVFDDKSKSGLLKKMLNSIRVDTIEYDLNTIICNYNATDWKGLFIKNEGIIEHCDKYRVAQWGNKIALSRSGADNWRRHSELYSYVLYLELFKEKQNVTYRDTSDEASWICIKWGNEYYYIVEEENSYKFGFCEGYTDSNGLNAMKQYVENIIIRKNLLKNELQL